MEFNEEELDNIIGGTPLDYETAMNKFKELESKKKTEEKIEEKSDELTAEDLDKYLGGVPRDVAEEYYEKHR